MSPRVICEPASRAGVTQQFGVAITPVLEPYQAADIVVGVASAKGISEMRKSLLMFAAAGSALALSACSQKTEDAAATAADSAASDTANNVDEAAGAVAGAASDVGGAVSEAADDTADAARTAGADASAAASDAAN